MNRDTQKMLEAEARSARSELSICEQHAEAARIIYQLFYNDLEKARARYADIKARAAVGR